MDLAPTKGFFGIGLVGPGEPLLPLPPTEEDLRDLPEPPSTLPEPKNEVVVLGPTPIPISSHQVQERRPGAGRWDGGWDIPRTGPATSAS